MDENPSALLPEILLAVAAIVGLLLGSYLPRHRQWLVRLLAAAACGAGVVATVVSENMAVFGGTYVVDVATNATRVVVMVSVVLVLCLADPIRGMARESEFVVLLVLAALGSVLLAGSNDLMLLAAAYLLASIPLYALAGFAKDAPGTEASLKFYLMGALLGVTTLAGVVVVFGLGGATEYTALSTGLATAPRLAVAVGVVAVLAGLLFKAGAVPAHFWVPDVTEGSGAVAAAFITTVPKIGAVVAIHRLITVASARLDWALVVAVIAAATMTLGNLAAFFQDNVRRLLAYSTISQVGYLLVGVAAAGHSDLALPAVLLYLGGYAVTNLGAFAVVCALPAATVLADFRGLLRRRPWLAVSLVVVLLGLVGTPPTVVFAGKLTVFTAALDAGLLWLVVVAVVNTVASVFYYLRWIGPAVRGEPADMPEPTRWAVHTAYGAAAGSVLLGVLTGPLLAALGA
ncbi:NADH-quinone oxidoreductase subunit N [Saccharothrix variisporea]|uniref:NADH-quinone oxidoreductase subunit N n=1 Tax=Saccharothrix variisporea TaxID=543527 RepID=A0A495XKD5_9PSEU|nr:proton-conducting transporter membrane subunit [Saccharothrix variisporea]RKT74577.1 NADH dehydrogenase subunit N [Saccharothrix variisporea]